MTPDDQPTKPRIKYAPPKLLKMEAQQVQGACFANGSGDADLCGGNGNSASSACDTDGINAGGPCSTSGVGV